MPYPTPVAQDDKALPLTPFDVANGQRLVMDGTEQTTAAFPDDGNGFSVVMVQNLADFDSNQLVFVRDDGQATTGDDANSYAIFPQESRFIYVFHTGRTISLFGPSGVVVHAVPCLAVSA